MKKKEIILIVVFSIIIIIGLSLGLFFGLKQPDTESKKGPPEPVPPTPNPSKSTPRYSYGVGTALYNSGSYQRGNWPVNKSFNGNGKISSVFTGKDNNKNELLMVGTNQNLWKSTDGSNWSSVTLSPPRPVLTVYYSNGYWLVGTNKNLFISQDGGGTFNVVLTLGVKSIDSSTKNSKTIFYVVPLKVEGEKHTILFTTDPTINNNFFPVILKSGEDDYPDDLTISKVRCGPNFNFYGFRSYR